MKNNIAKQIGIAIMSIIVILNLVSCVATQPHQNQGGYYPPQQQPQMVMPPSGYPPTMHPPQNRRGPSGPEQQYAGPSSAQPRLPAGGLPGTHQTPWRLGDNNTHTRWYYNPKTKQPEKVFERKLGAEEFQQAAEAAGAERFSEEIPLDGQMPKTRRGNNFPGKPPGINNGVPQTSRRPVSPPLPPAADQSSFQPETKTESPPWA